MLVAVTHPSSTSPSKVVPSTDIAVRMVNISKRFGAVKANQRVNLDVMAGSVHGLVGENGAGKSTLMSILYGFYEADEGHIELGGQVTPIRRSQDAIAHGVGMVHQHFMLVETLTALDNIMLGAEPSAFLHQAERQVRAALTTVMADSGLVVDLDAKVADLPVGDQQRLEILKALYRGAKVLILDEPTAVLTPQETTHLFGVLRRLKDRGTTIILITHKLKEVMALCDRVTVMRAGQIVHESDIKDTQLALLAEAMVGRKVNTGRQGMASSAPGEVRLAARDLNVSDRQGVARLRQVSLTLRAGEIVGVAGVSGNGQSELLEVLSGLLVPSSGTLQVGEQHFSVKPGAGVTSWLNPRQARALGVAHVPEDRHARALVMSFGAWESAVLGYEALPQYSRGGWMVHPDMQKATETMMERFDVRPRDAQLKSAKFSGGNQQKLVLARELGQSPRILLVGQPTRGVDIGAIEFIHGQLRAMRDAGCAVLLVSSELDEILALADRVVVMNQARITGDLPIGECTEARLGLLMVESSSDEVSA